MCSSPCRQRPNGCRSRALSAYLNGLQTAEADFTQINADGTISTGRLYIKRPGRVRFEYTPPDKTLVMAGGGQVAIFDGGSNNSQPEQYPLARTPLNLILERNVDLGRRSMVVGHDYDGTATVVTAQDPEHPEYGRSSWSSPPTRSSCASGSSATSRARPRRSRWAR